MLDLSKEKLVADQKTGGVFLVFLSGKNNTEIKDKVKCIKEFCKTLDGKCKNFAEVKPVYKIY